MSLPKYPEYKDSGVSWLGEVPAHWEVKKLKHLATLTTGLTPQSDNPVFYSDDGFPWVRPEDLSENQLVLASKFLSDEGCALVRKVKPFSTLICCIGTIGKIGYVGVEASTNQQITAASFSGYPRYFFYQAISARETFEQSATGNVIKILNSERLGSISFICPSYDEQVLVAHFLDRETAKIDALIAEQEKLIALLAEKRQATISRAVTRGLDPNVPLKDSGVPWLGKVPAHWEVCAVRRILSKVEQGWSPECESRPAEDGEWGVLKAGCVNRGIFDPQENKALPNHLQPVEELMVKAGDLLMSRASGSPQLVGSVAYISEARFGLMLSDKIFRLHLIANADPKYFAWQFNSKALRTQIERAISGADGLANNLPQSSMKEFSIAKPPVDEQRHIAAFLEKAVAQLEMLSAEASKAILLLKERRAALISAAVTGKIDVRGLAA